MCASPLSRRMAVAAWIRARAPSAASMIVRRGSLSAQTPPISTKQRLRQDARDQHDAEVGRRAAQLEHRERERDREDAVAEPRGGLAPEEEREIALAQTPTGSSRRSRERA